MRDALYKQGQRREVSQFRIQLISKILSGLYINWVDYESYLNLKCNEFQFPIPLSKELSHLNLMD